MSEEPTRAFTKGDIVSRAVLRLAADRGWDDTLDLSAGVVELAHRHGLAAALASETADPFATAVGVRESLRSRTLSEHLPRLLERLGAAGIKVAVVKGPSVAALYRNPRLRSFSDLDLLVPEDQLDLAIEALSADEALVEVPPKRPTLDKRDLWFADGRGVGFNVDLHWNLFSYSQLRGSASAATAEAWDRAVFADGLGESWDLPMAHRIGFLAAHAILDHRFRLILFRDFLEIERLGVDWDDVLDVAARHGLRSTTYLSLWISREALGVPVPPDFLEELRPRSLPVGYLEWALPKTDIVRFDGHTARTQNLAAVLLNDSASSRVALAVRSPLAVRGWRGRVRVEEASRETPRTLVVVTNDRRRGAEVNAERLRDGLNARGWVIEAVSLYDTGADPPVRIPTLVEARSEESRFELRVLLALVRKIRSFRPDVVVANGGPTLRYCVAAALSARFRLVYVGIGEARYWIRSRASLLINRFLLRRADAVLAVSGATGDQLMELEPSLRGRVHTAHSGVPDSLLRLPDRTFDGPLRMLVVGRLSETKNPLLALRAAAGVDAGIIRFVGSGPLQGDLAHEAERLGLVDRVELTGSVVDVAEHLEWAHVLVLTSRTEGLPGAILEAAASGLPTVALDVGGVREAVIDGETGVVVGSEDELVRALALLDVDRDLLKSMSLAARDHIRTAFTMDRFLERYGALLTMAWRTRPRRADAESGSI